MRLLASIHVGQTFNPCHNSPSLPPTDLAANVLEDHPVPLEEGRQEVRGSIRVARRLRDEAVLPQKVKVVADGPVVEPECVAQLVCVVRSRSQRLEDPRPVHAATSPREQIPEELSQSNAQRIGHRDVE